MRRVSFRSSRFLRLPDRKDRALCGCQCVASMISASVAPRLRESILVTVEAFEVRAGAGASVTLSVVAEYLPWWLSSGTHGCVPPPRAPSVRPIRAAAFLKAAIR